VAALRRRGGRAESRGAGTNLLEVARAHGLLADVAGELAVEIERQDLASRVLVAGRRQRRSA
jgi:hypothetical protein